MKLRPRGCSLKLVYSLTECTDFHLIILLWIPAMFEQTKIPNQTWIFKRCFASSLAKEPLVWNDRAGSAAIFSGKHATNLEHEIVRSENRPLGCCWKRIAGVMNTYLMQHMQRYVMCWLHQRWTRWFRFSVKSGIISGSFVSSQVNYLPGLHCLVREKNSRTVCDFWWNRIESNWIIWRSNHPGSRIGDIIPMIFLRKWIAHVHIVLHNVKSTCCPCLLIQFTTSANIWPFDNDILEKLNNLQKINCINFSIECASKCLFSNVKPTVNVKCSVCRIINQKRFSQKTSADWPVKTKASATDSEMSVAKREQNDFEIDCC